MALVDTPNTACGFLAAADKPVDLSVSTNQWHLLSKSLKTSGVNTLHNTGKAYDESTGYFTAPANGTYIVSGATTVFGHNGVFKLYISINDDTNPQALMAQSSDLSSTSNEGTTIDVSGVIRLNAGDKVALYYNPSKSSFSLRNTSFSAAMLKQMARSHALASMPAGGVSMNTYYVRPDQWSTTCKFCVSSPDFSGAGYQAPVDGTYYIDLMFEPGNIDYYYGYASVTINGGTTAGHTMYICKWVRLSEKKRLSVPVKLGLGSAWLCSSLLRGPFSSLCVPLLVQGDPASSKVSGVLKFSRLICMSNPRNSFLVCSLFFIAAQTIHLSAVIYLDKGTTVGVY